MSRGPCTYLVCSSHLTSYTRLRVDQGVLTIGGDLWTTNFMDLTLCPDHERLVEAARKIGHQIVRTREGWVYVDNLLWLFMRTP